MKVLNPVIFFSSLLILECGLAVSGYAQSSVAECSHWREIPGDILPFVYLAQDKSDVIIADGKAYLVGHDTLELSVVVENKSNKPIRQVSLSFWNLGGGGGDRLPFNLSTPIAPGKSQRIGGPSCMGVPFMSKKELADRGYKDEIQTLVVVSMREVVFKDGSVLTDKGLTERFHRFEGMVNIDRNR